MSDELEMKAFQIITFVGSARSNYIEAIQAAKRGQFEEAMDLMKQGEECFIEGHHAHAELLAMEADGKPVAVSLLLLHAEDQLMSAEGFKMIAEEFIDVYKKMNQ